MCATDNARGTTDLAQQQELRSIVSYTQACLQRHDVADRAGRSAHATRCGTGESDTLAGTIEASRHSHRRSDSVDTGSTTSRIAMPICSSVNRASQTLSPSLTMTRMMALLVPMVARPDASNDVREPSSALRRRVCFACRRSTPVRPHLCARRADHPVRNPCASARPYRRMLTAQSCRSAFRHRSLSRVYRWARRLLHSTR